MRCAYCGTVVQPGAERCIQCDVRIVWDGDTAKFLVPEGHVPVFIAREPAKLAVIKSLLIANEIPFLVSDDISQDFMSWGRFIAGYSPVTGPPIVRVPGEYAQAARELIASEGHTTEEEPPEP